MDAAEEVTQRGPGPRERGGGPLFFKNEGSLMVEESRGSGGGRTTENDSVGVHTAYNTVDGIAFSLQRPFSGPTSPLP